MTPGVFCVVQEKKVSDQFPFVWAHRVLVEPLVGGLHREYRLGRLDPDRHKLRAAY